MSTARVSDLVVEASERDVAGLEQDFEGLFREHHRTVHRTAYGVTGNAQDAEDVAQTVFLRVLHQGAARQPRRNAATFECLAVSNLKLLLGGPASSGALRSLIDQLERQAGAAAHYREAVPSAGLHAGQAQPGGEGLRELDDPDSVPLDAAPLPLLGDASVLHRERRDAGATPRTSGPRLAARGALLRRAGLRAHRSPDLSGGRQRPGGAGAARRRHVARDWARQPPGFDDLSVEEKIAYVQSLWDRIAASPETIPLPDWHLEILDERHGPSRRVAGDGMAHRPARRSTPGRSRD